MYTYPDVNDNNLNTQIIIEEQEAKEQD